MKPNEEIEFTNKLLSPLEISSLSNNQKISYIIWLQGKLLNYQLVISLCEDKNKKYHR